MKAPRWIAAIALAWAGACASAHEFWMLPDTFVVARPGPVTLGLFVGVRFQGDRVAFDRSVVTRLADISASGTTELTSTVSRAPVGDFTFAASHPGTHMVVMDSSPSRIDLPAETFNAYLRDEGLDNALAARQEAGMESAPGRERFRRHVKALLQVGTAAHPAAPLRSGQRFDIVPLLDPAALHAGGEIAFQVFFDGRPAAGVLVKSWRRQGEQAPVSSARTDPAGMVTLAFASPGTWMVSAVQMRPVTDGTPGLDWDSYWASLTFRMPP